MSDASRSRMISAYIEESAVPAGFLSSMFRTPPENFYTSEEVEIDIQRNGEDIAIAVQDLSVKGRANEATKFTNKSFAPPIFDEKFPVKAWEQMARQAGMNPFDNVDFMSSAFASMRSNMRRGEQMIRRTIELQAAQVLQTGAVSLIDTSGAVNYNINYAPKTTHFPQSGTTWASSTTKLLDLESLADLILVNGHTEANMAIFGKTAWRYFINDSAVQDLLNNRRIDVGAINRPLARGGGKYHGTISVGQYTLELWTYAGWYKHPQTGVATDYLTADSVIVKGEGRLDLTFGAIPMIVPPDPRVAPLTLGRMSGAGVDMQTHAWVSEDGRTIWGSVAARPLCIPTAIDTFGCIDTVH